MKKVDNIMFFVFLPLVGRKGTHTCIILELLVMISSEEKRNGLDFTVKGLLWFPQVRKWLEKKIS